MSLNGVSVYRDAVLAEDFVANTSTHTRLVNCPVVLPGEFLVLEVNTPAPIHSNSEAIFLDEVSVAPAQRPEESSDSDDVVIGGFVSHAMPDRKPEAERRGMCEKDKLKSMHKFT